MKCPNCGKEMIIMPEKVGLDENDLPVFHRMAYCDRCRSKKDLDGPLQDNPYHVENNDATKERDPFAGGNWKSSNTNPEPKKKISMLGVVALLLSFFSFTRIIGVVVALIDLVRGRKDGKSHWVSWLALTVAVVLAILSTPSSNKTSNDNSSTSISKEASIEENIEEINDQSTEHAKDVEVVTASSSQEEETASVSTVVDEAIQEIGEKATEVVSGGQPDEYKDMRLGDIGRIGDVNVGLSYVKKMNVLPTALGDYTYDEIESGHEVILGFFDFYNDSEYMNRVDPSSITCYADGVQVGNVEGNAFYVACDGVRQFHTTELDDYTSLMSVQDFSVPTGWTELKFFYKSTCVWTVTQEDIRTEAFTFSSMYEPEIQREPTEEGTVIYNEDYEIIFKGATEYVHDNIAYGPEKYIVFKFTINNTSEKALDYSHAGHKMVAYQDNYQLFDADYSLDVLVDGHSNIFGIDTIEPGMTANIYVAFSALKTDGDLYMIYDDGYIDSSYRGAVFVDR